MRLRLLCRRHGDATESARQLNLRLLQVSLPRLVLDNTAADAEEEAARGAGKSLAERR